MIFWCGEPHDGKLINTDSKAEPPWNRLSPDYQQGQIPVPGLKGMQGDCVRGIMEGLKLIGPISKPGKINPGYFVGPGRERPVKKDEWLLGYSLTGLRCDLATARRNILIPAYRWVLWNKCHDLVGNLQEMGRHQDVWIHDGVASCDIDDPSPFSCAFVLVEFLNHRDGRLDQPLVLQ